MLAPNSPIYGNLANATSKALAGLQRSVGRTLRASNAVESMRDSGNGGQFSYATRMESDTRKKNETLRGGQVYFLHNDIKSINHLKNKQNQL